MSLTRQAVSHPYPAKIATILTFNELHKKWGTVGYSGVQWGIVGYSGVLWGTVGYCGVQWGTSAIVGEEVKQAGKPHMPLKKE